MTKFKKIDSNWSGPSGLGRGQRGCRDFAEEAFIKLRGREEHLHGTEGERAGKTIERGQFLPNMTAD